MLPLAPPANAHVSEKNIQSATSQLLVVNYYIRSM